MRFYEGNDLKFQSPEAETAYKASINRLKDANDAKSKEGQDQAERIKDIDYQLARTSQRIEETQKLVDARNYDLRNK